MIDLPNRIKKIKKIDSDLQNRKSTCIPWWQLESSCSVHFWCNWLSSWGPSNQGWPWSELTSNVPTVQDRIRYERYVPALTFRPLGVRLWERERDKTKTSLGEAVVVHCGLSGAVMKWSIICSMLLFYFAETKRRMIRMEGNSEIDAKFNW